MSVQKYIIVNLSDVTAEMWEDAYQTDDIPHNSNDGLMTILSYRGTKPSSFGGATVMNNSEIIEELKKDEWFVEVDDDGDPI